MERNAREVVILPVACASRHGAFGLRLERQSDGDWSGTWAFKLKKGVAEKEGYSSRSIKNQGRIIMDGRIGCPHCENVNIFLCSCEVFACYDGRSNPVTCPTCRQQIELGGEITDWNASGDA